MECEEEPAPEEGAVGAGDEEVGVVPRQGGQVPVWRHHRSPGALADYTTLATVTSDDLGKENMTSLSPLN